MDLKTAESIKHNIFEATHIPGKVYGLSKLKNVARKNVEI